MNKVALSILGIAALIATPAIAADMAVKAPPPAAPPAAPGWTGFYIGGNIGGVINTNTGTSNFTDTSAGAGAFPVANSFHAHGFLGGGQAGYNWQFDPRWLVGVEADGDFTHAKYTFCRGTFIPSVCGDTGFGADSLSSKTDWLSTVRGRFGAIAMNNFLFYATGGAAWGRIETTASQTCLVSGCGLSGTLTAGTSTNSVTRSGWVAGLGGEWNIDGNWFARAEWLHIDLGSFTSSVATAGALGTVQTFSWSRSERYNEIRFGLDYRFWHG